MKQIKIISSALCFSYLLFTVSCGNAGEKAEATFDTVKEAVTNAVDSVKENIGQYRDEDFVKDVAKANAAELHLLALAQKKATSKEIKINAKRMEADHKKMDDEVNAYAAKHGISVNIDNNDVDNTLDNNATGADWDRNWVNKMVDDHEKILNKFEDFQDDATDAELKTMITNTLPTLRNHLQMAKDMQTKMAK
jgi:putative membrane protein